MILFLFKIIRNFTIGILFLFLQIGIILKFIRVCLDDIYNQQLPLLALFWFRFLFRYIIYNCLSKNALLIPGISLRLLYRMFYQFITLLWPMFVAFGGKEIRVEFWYRVYSMLLMFPVVVKWESFSQESLYRS